MKQSIAIIFSLGLLHYTVHGAPNIFSSILTTATNYLNEKINKTAEAVGQALSLTNGIAQLGSSLTGPDTYMGTSNSKAGLSSAATILNEATSGIVNVLDKELGFVSNITERIPMVGEPISQVPGTGSWGLDLVYSVANDLLNLTESFGKAGLTATNTVSQLTTGVIEGVAHGGAAVGKQIVQAIASGITNGIRAITGTSEN